MKQQPKKPSNTNKSLAEWEAAAQTAMQRQAYKEAIAAYKALLKQEAKAEWREGLAEAYLQRALAVAGKGLYPEACILWESHAELRQSPQHSEAYAGWLLRVGNFAKLGVLCKRYPQLLEEGAEGRRLSEMLGVLLLDNDKLAAQLPPDSAPLKHCALARQALQAYCAHNDEQAEALLQQIPVRSPYRDWRLLLKALLAWENERTAAVAALEKIPADSPYRNLADLIARQGHTDVQAFEAIAELPQALRTFFQRFSGLDKDKDRLERLRDAHKLSRTYSAKSAFDTVLAHRQSLGQAHSKQLCFELLPYYPNGMKLYEKQFEKLSEFDKERIYALRSETDRSGHYDWYDIDGHWKGCIALLEAQPNDPENRLKRALIWRHLAEKLEGNKGGRAIACLKKSLELDSDDKPCFTLLLGLMEKRQRPQQQKDYLEWLDRALKQYPKDVDILLLAMRAAEKKKAFKKAAGIAQTLLEVDAINLQAKRTLVRCHASHARKLIGSEKYALAEKELAQAQRVEQGRESGLVQILRGLMAFQQGDTAQAGTLLREGYALRGGSLCARFCVAAEALCLRLPLTKVMGLLPKPGKADVPNKREIGELPPLVAQYQQDNGKAAVGALKHVDKMLRDAVRKQAYTVEERVDLCERWMRAAQYSWLQYYASLCVAACPDQAIFIYYQAYGHCKGEPRQLTFWNRHNLMMAMELAQEHGDKRAGALIGGFLDRYFDGGEDDDDDDGEYDEYGEPISDDPVAQMLGIDRAEMERLEREIEQFDRLGPMQRVQLLFGDDAEKVLSGSVDPQKLLLERIMGKLGSSDIDKILDQIMDLPGGVDPFGKPSKRRQ